MLTTVGSPLSTVFSQNGSVGANDTQNNLSIPERCLVLKASTASDFIPWDNPDDPISRHVERTFDTLVVGVLYILFLISAPTNVINMAVFYKHGLQERINFCLFVQSLVDLVYMVFNFIYYSDRIYLEIAKGERRGAVLFFILENFLMGFYGLAWVSAFVTMVIACERCFCVVSPLKSRTILKTSTTGLIILTLSLILLALFFVVMTKWGVRCVFDPTTNTKSLMAFPREFYLKNRQLLETLDVVVNGVVFPTVIDLTVTLSTVITVVKLKQMTSWRGRTSSFVMSSRELALTRMLVGTSLLFIVCTAPAMPFRVVFLVVPDLSLNGRYYNSYNFFGNVAKLFTYINSSANFLIYYAMGSRYRETAKAIFAPATRASDNARDMHSGAYWTERSRE